MRVYRAFSLCSAAAFAEIALAFAVLWQSLAAFGASGQLMDQNGQPLANAWVVATREECNGIAHCNTFCKEVKVARTDPQGRYSFDSGLRSLGQYALYLYLEGYLPRYRHTGLRSIEHFMERGATDPRFAKFDPLSARLAHLAWIAQQISCFTAPRDQRLALIPLYRTMFREASSLARYPEHHRVARRICSQIYNAQRGPDTPSYPPDAERADRWRILEAIEPACNAPLDDGQERAILAALEQGNPGPIRAAAAEKFDFNRRLDGSNPPIIIATRKGAADIVRELAAGGARVDEVSETQVTALDYALGLYGPRPRRLAVVAALLDAGADANRPNQSGYPPLLQVARATPADVELFELLLRHGARIDATVACADCGGRGNTVLHLAVDAAIIRIALERGVDPNARDASGWTPLMYMMNSPAKVRLLLERGADPNLATKDQWTPLMMAVRDYESWPESRPRTRELAELLVRAGARLEGRNGWGREALDYTKDEELKKKLRALAAQR